MENGGKEGEEGRPRDINVLQFAKQRVTQIAELLDVIDNHALVSGEVTKGPRTALQRLPRHMRRRAMSYNIKRFPRSQRSFAASTVAVSKHRHKPPSRFWRRRPRNLLLNYIRRQRKQVWLETHIWHAKRFHMGDKWGYRVPIRSFQRAFRATYRDAMRHCVVRDTSFLTCFQVCCDKESELVEALRPLCHPSTSATFAFKSALDGRFEVSTLLYQPGNYPQGFIGPVRFSWTAHSSVTRSLQIWCHPSHSTEVLNHLVDALGVSKEKGGEGDIPKNKPRNCDEWRLLNSRIHTTVYEGERFKLIDLSDQLVRFSLHGPQSMSVLRSVLSTADCGTEPWMRSFRSNNAFWNETLRNRGPGELPDGTVLSLLVEDPRLSRPARKTRPNQGTPSNTPIAVADIPAPRSEFWHLDIRQKVLASKTSEADLHKQRASSLVPICTSPTKVPVLLVVRNSGTGTSNTLTGVDVVAPGGFGMELWLGLQYGTAHAGALNDELYAGLDADRLNFPADVPDCKAGYTEMQQESENLVNKYLSKPHNRRVRYWSGLSVKYPFDFEWDALVREWGGQDQDMMESESRSYVLRDRRQLVALERWLAGKAPPPEEVLTEHRRALVAVRLTVLGSGRPRRLALICLPSDDDFNKVASSPCGEKVRFEEPKRSQTVKLNENVNDRTDGQDDEEKGDDEMEGFIELNTAKKETLLSLSAMFPDKDLLRNRKRVAAKRLKRQKCKMARREGVAVSKEESDGDVTERIEPSDVSYRDSCSREVIGRVVRGEFAFSSGRGRALGYCSLLALRGLRNGNVLLRNPSSKYYHPARLSILTSQPHF